MTWSSMLCNHLDMEGKLNKVTKLEWEQHVAKGKRGRQLEEGDLQHLTSFLSDRECGKAAIPGKLRLT